MKRNLWRPYFVLATLPIAFASHCFATHAAPPIPPNTELRLAITADVPNGNIRLTLENISQSTLGVFVAMKSGTGTDYLFRFTAIAPDGTQFNTCHSWAESSGYVAGMLVPEVITLAPRATREFQFPLEGFVCMASGKQVQVSTLLRKGSTLTASLEVQQKDLDGASMGGIPRPPVGHLWIGRLTSSVRLPESSR